MEKNWKRYSLKHSFAAKVCFWVLATSMCVFVIAFGTGLWFASRQMQSEGHQKANIELDKALQFVNNELSSVELAGKNLEMLWETENPQTPEELFSICRAIVKTNHQIQGACIALKPNAIPSTNKLFAPYVMMTNKGKMIERDLAYTYKYLEKPWYKQTVQKKRAWWTSPFTEANGTIVVSYCLPIKSKNGKVMGAFVLDMSLTNLTKHVESIKPYPNSFITVMDRKLNFIVHPDKDLILKGTPSQVLNEKNYEVNETIFVDIKNHVRGMGAFGEKGDQKFLYYAPLKHTGWTITLECDKDEITSRTSQICKQMLIITLLGILTLLFTTLGIMRKFLHPIRLYSKAALQIARGNLHTPIPRMKDHNELWALGESLNNMQKSLEKHIKDLEMTTKAKSRIESELNIASRIQMSMIPKIFPPYPERDDLDIYGTLIPAKAVGGDLYDFFLRDEKLFFCIGDVSGKGVPASLLMAVTRSLVRIVAAQESKPEKIISSLNYMMSDMNDSNMFVTLFVGVLDMPTGRFRYCNAGHNAPVIIDGKTHKAKMLDVKPNLPVAIIQDMQFEMQETVITPDSTIFLYTDGLTEAENANKELFGEDRMMEVLSQTGALTAEEQVNRMLESVHQHVKDAEQSDDLTLTAIKYERHQRDTKFYQQITLHNDISETPKIAEFIDNLVKENELDLSLAGNMNLALEEAVVNVMNYAYPKGQKGDINLEVYANEARIKFVITDEGTPFDPTTKADPDINASLDDRPIGGLGIFLVRQLMDSVNYERINNKNILTLRKML